MVEYFQFEKNRTSLRIEVVAGITTFLATLYIIVVKLSVVAT